MGFDDSIVNKKNLAILEQVKNTKTLVRIKLKGRDTEQLSVLSDIRYKGKAMYLLIDCPTDFAGLTELPSTQMQCEFTGSDKLPYFFDADIAQVDQNEIWVLIPNLIRRREARRDFRVDVPSGTYMIFKKLGVLFKSQIINLSQGGSLGSLISDPALDRSVWPLCAGDALTEVDLTFRSKLFVQRVSIRKAVVVRFEENQMLHSHWCAIHFVDMDKSEEKALTELIYVIQRESLQKRLPLAD